MEIKVLVGTGRYCWATEKKENKTQLGKVSAKKSLLQVEKEEQQMKLREDGNIQEEEKKKIANNKASENKTSGRPMEEMPQSTVEQQVQLTFCCEQIFGIAAS